MRVDRLSVLDRRAQVSVLVVGAALAGLAAGAAADGYRPGLLGWMAVAAASLAGIAKSASP